MRKLLPDLEDDILEFYEEHQVADVLCMELYAMKPDAERFDAKMTVLIENVKHHMEEKEQDWFPKVRNGLSRTKLRVMASRRSATGTAAACCPAMRLRCNQAVAAVSPVQWSGILTAARSSPAALADSDDADDHLRSEAKPHRR